MATFVEVVPDPFASNFAITGATEKDLQTQSRSGAVGTATRFAHVRRPVRGIEIKDDTYATLQVVKANGDNQRLIDAAGVSGWTNRYSNFLIQSINETRAEKSQIVVTFGEPYIFFFGEQPRVVQVQGVLLNTVDFNWRAEFLENYDKYMRGTQCVRSKARVYLAWDDIVTEGYIMNCEIGEQASERNYVTFSFQMFLTNYQNISGIGDPEAHLRGKLINLTPDQIDTFGAAAQGFQSSALAVRKANVAEAASRKSLLGMLRDGELLSAFNSGTSRLVELQDTVQNLLDKAADFVAGRNIRVPRGFEGASAFDADVQLDIASLLPGGAANEFQVQGIIGGQQFTIKAVTGDVSSPQQFGPLSLNTDEFIGRGQPAVKSSDFVDLFKPQRGDDVVAAAEVRRIFKIFGIDTEPPSEIMQLVGRATFGLVNYVGGNALASITDQGTRQAINVIPRAIL